MTITMILQPKICTMCQKDAESPYNSQWNSLTNEKIILCTKECFELHSSLKGYNFKYESILEEMKKQIKSIKE
jgi:hypothetical protein